MCCATTAKVNDIGEKVWRHRNRNASIYGWHFRSRRFRRDQERMTGNRRKMGEYGLKNGLMSMV